MKSQTKDPLKVYSFSFKNLSDKTIRAILRPFTEKQKVSAPKKPK